MSGIFKKIVVLLIGMMLVNGGFQVDFVKAAVPMYTYSYTEKPDTTEVNGSYHYTEDGHMVWVESVQGKSQVFYQTIGLAGKTQITNHAEPVSSPVVSEDHAGNVWIVWEDKRIHSANGAVNRNWDIYAYNLKSGEEWKLNSTVDENGNASIDGHLVTWMKGPRNDIYVYDLLAKQETYIGKGRFPVISEGRVVFKSATDGGLFLYTVATGQTERILELPYIQYVDWFAYKGNTVVWKQRDLDRKTKYTMMHVDGSGPVDLTQPFVKDIEHSNIIIDGDQAAWTENKNGVRQIVGANLSNGQTYQVTTGSEDQELLGFEGNDLLYMNNDNKITHVTILRTEIIPREQGPTGTSDTESTVSESINVGISIGAEGGTVEADGAKLTIPKAAFKQTSLVELELLDGMDSSKYSKPKMSVLSELWEIRSEMTFQLPALLSIKFDVSTITSEQLRKVALYRLDPKISGWQYVGGLADMKLGELTGTIRNTGTYAVILYEPTFDDLQGHWAKKNVEILASRWIVNGMNDSEFQPNTSLTRAQFIKLLVSAAGISTKGTEKTTFNDVSKDHWGHAWIEAAAQAEWVTGYNGSFQPDERLNREQMMTMIVKAMNGEEEALGLSELEMNEALAFGDVAQISNWAKPYAAWIVQQGLIKGSGGMLQPGGTSSRAEGATVIFGWLVEKGEL